jgi:protein-disulfide isomerase
MNSLDRKILAFFITLAATVLCYVWYSFYHQKRNIPEPKIVHVDPRLLIGPLPSYKGDANAPFTLIEFADYQCPACEASWSHVTDELRRYPRRLRLVFHHFPLRMHPRAFPAATAAEAVRQQGKFWSMHEVLMLSKGHLTEEDIRFDVEKLNINPGRFQRERQTSAETSVRADLALAQKLGVKSTPTYFLLVPGDRIYQLGALTQLETIVDRAK